MKNKTFLVVFGILFSFEEKVLAQQATIENYKTFDIRNTSGEVFNSVNVELNNSSYNLAFYSLKKLYQDKYSLHSKTNIDGFIREFNQTLNNTKNRYASQEFLWKTGKEIGKYGLSVLGNYAEALPTKHITNFLTPALQQSYELYVDNEIQNGIEEHKEDMDKIIKDRINLLYSNGIDVRNANSEMAFYDLFALSHADIPALNRDQYGIFNKELIKRAYDFISVNRTQIQLLDLRVSQQYENVKQQLNYKIDIFQKKITEDVNYKFKELGSSIAELVKNQESIFKTLDNIQVRVKANELKLAALEQEMIRFKDDVVRLKEIQETHSQLLAQNSFQIDILSGYTYQNLNTKEKILALEKGHFNNIFNDSEKQKLIDELKDIRNRETIISVSCDIENYSNAVYGGLVNTGIIKGKSAQNVGKFISTVSVLSGIARVYAGDISGLTSIVSGLGGLFGKPTPSPEIQMLTQIYDVMNQRFDRIDKHLEIIETKLDTLASITINMYKTMVLSFQYSSNQLENINWKVNNLNIKATALLYKDYQACKTLMDIWKERNVSFNAYSDYVTYFGQECKQCLQGLTDFTIGKNNSYFFVSTNEQLKNEDVIKNEITEIFNPTKDLFKIFYGKNLNTASYALMFPFSTTSNSNRPLYYVSKLDNIIWLDTRDVFDDYFSYEMINEFTDLFLRFMNYFLIKGSNENFKPQTLNYYFKSNPINGVNQDLVETRLTKLLNIVQYSISQQSMISGNLMLDPIYSTLFSYSTDENAKDLSIKVLKNNRILAANFAIYLINKNLDLSDTLKVQRIFNNASLDKKSLDSLNSLMILNDVKFKSDAKSKFLSLSFDIKGQTIDLLCPDFITILDNKMINSDAVYSLLNSSKKIYSKLIDLTFTKNLRVAESMDQYFKYYYNTTFN